MFPASSHFLNHKNTLYRSDDLAKMCLCREGRSRQKPAMHCCRHACSSDGSAFAHEAECDDHLPFRNIRADTSYQADEHHQSDESEWLGTGLLAAVLLHFFCTSPTKLPPNIHTNQSRCPHSAPIWFSVMTCCAESSLGYNNQKIIQILESNSTSPFQPKRLRSAGSKMARFDSIVDLEFLDHDTKLLDDRNHEISTR